MHMVTGLPELPRVLHPKTGDVVVAQNLPTGRGRWTPLRKCLVIEGIKNGLISEEYALANYGFSKDELLNMQALYSRFGLSGLKVEKRYVGMGMGNYVPREETVPCMIEVQDVVLGEEDGAAPGIIEVRDVVLDREAGTVHVGRRHVHFPLQQVLVLELLMLNAGRVVSHDELMAYLYDARKRERADQAILKVLVCNLQKKLRCESSHTYIETVWGLGYRFRDA